jgi:hypothetical protein
VERRSPLGVEKSTQTPWPGATSIRIRQRSVRGPEIMPYTPSTAGNPETVLITAVGNRRKPAVS